MSKVIKAAERQNGYTPREFLGALWKLNMAVLDACHEGKVVCDSGFWKRDIKEFKKVKKIYA